MQRTQLSLGEYTPPVICPTHDGTRYVVFESFDFYGDTVPAGFIFNGASVPRLFWRVVSPGRPFLLFASAGHDYLYHYGIGTKEGADDKFYEALLDGGCGPKLAWLMYRSVRFGGKGNF